MRHGEGRKEENDEMSFAGVAWPKEKNWIHLFLYNDVQSSAIFMKWCTKIRQHKWRCDVKLVRHVEGRKEENNEMGFAGVAWPKEKNWISFSL